ncbi:MAG: asparaginase domain-containing protein [Pseudomonadales bacterium]
MTSSNITLITTGGTIGSSIQSDSVNVSQGQQQLMTHIQTFCQQQAITLSTEAAFNKNSEDLDPTDWLTLIQCVEQVIANGADKIVITHGTDTMAYTAAAISLCFSQHDVKIVLTGSFYSLDHPDSDVTKNLQGAFATINEPQVPNGVHVSFTNQAGETHVMDAQDIKPMAFDEQQFKATFGQLIGTFKTSTSQFEASRQPRITQCISSTLQSSGINNTSLTNSHGKIIQLACYPGLDVMHTCANLTAGSCVIINLYHSGTGPALQTKEGLLEAIKSFPQITFLLTPLPTPYITKPYTSTLTLLQAGALLYQDIQPHVLYVLLTLGMASGQKTQDILAQLKSFQVQPKTP